MVISVGGRIVELCQRHKDRDWAFDRSIHRCNAFAEHRDATVAVMHTQDRGSYASAKVRHQGGGFCACISEKVNSTHLLGKHLVVLREPVIPV